MAASATISLGDLDRYMTGLSFRITHADFLPAWKRVSVLLAASMKQNFARQSAPNGTPWTPIKQYRARGASGRLRVGKALRDRGLLMASATGKGPDHFEQSRSQSFIWGSNLNYARIHQEGGVIRPVNAKALAIPLTREAYRAGSPRNFPKALDVVWPKGRSSGWLVERKPGRAKSGIGAKDILHYKLASKVTIPARPFVGMNEELITKTVLILLDHLRGLLKT